MSTKTSGPAVNKLRDYFKRNGYLRMPDERADDREGNEYKKGYEARLVANSTAELREIRACLKAVGLPVRKAFAKGNQHVQPLYGKETVQSFMKMIKSRKK